MNNTHKQGQLLPTLKIGQRVAMRSQLINISRQRTIHTQGQLLSTLTIGQRVGMSSQLINLSRQRTIHT